MGKIGDSLVQQGVETVGNLVDTGMGLLLEGHNDKRQLKQQGKLQALQIAGQKDLTDYNTQKQLDLWNATSYPAQMENLKKAGLNPGLLYGQGGGGGQTANIAQGSVSGAEAPKGGQEIMGMALLRAQIANLNAQTAKTQAEAENVPKQGANIEQDTALKAVNTKIAEIQARLNDQKFQYDLQGAYEAMVQLGQQNRILSSQADVAEGTQATQIQQAQQNLAKTTAEVAGQYLENKLTDEKISLTAEQKKEVIQKVKNLINEVTVSNREVDIDQQVANFQTQFGTQVGGVIGSLLNLIPAMSKKRK